MPAQDEMADQANQAMNKRTEDEVDRLRALVGPTESSYADLRAEIATARDEGRKSEAELGKLRAEITELRVELHRAQQDQYHMRRLILFPAIAVRNRLQRRRTAAAADQG